MYGVQSDNGKKRVAVIKLIKFKTTFGQRRWRWRQQQQSNFDWICLNYKCLIGIHVIYFRSKCVDDISMDGLYEYIVLNFNILDNSARAKARERERVFHLNL